MSDERKKNAAIAAEAVIQRLMQMRRLWEDAAASYFDPPRFQINLQNCITVSRTVTFILQSNKQHMEGFDEWYEAHRARWNGDPIMRWARDARNSIEKKGDLETYSQVRAMIIASYLDGPQTHWFPQMLSFSPREVYRAVPPRFLIPHVIENGTLLIERRWVDNQLPDMEVLEALSYVYGQLADTVVDFIKVNNLKTRLRLEDTRPDAMGALAMDRAIYLSMRDGSTTGFRYFRKPVEEPTQKMRNFIKKRYGPKASWDGLEQAKTFREVAERFFNIGRVMLLRDGHHRSLTFFLRGNMVFQILPTEYPDRASKYVLMRDLAKLARIEGADAVMMIAEAWTASREDIPTSGFAADAKRRGEALLMQAANFEGETFALEAAFHRRRFGGKKIKSIEPTVFENDAVQFSLFPFLREWGVLDEEKIAKAVQQEQDMGIQPPFIPGA